ncbi:MAG: FtsX-like permease family protein [candidate division Zixibacteria bacterium]|nr:FtsX-like permease family protein [candidate division Zixibacteria bacterium]
MLTIFGLAIAIMAYCIITTIINSYYASADIAPPDRLVTRSSVSIIFDLPLAYKNKIEKVPGVLSVTYANWFGGIYKNDPKNFFANFAVSPENFLEMYTEYIIPPEQKDMYLKEKNSCLVGQKLADRFGWKIGDPIVLTGQIFPGDWEFVLRAIFKGREPGVDENAMFFRWDYFDEELKKTTPGMAGGVGWYVIKIDNPDNAAAISAEIDRLFENSAAETMTETEKSFTLSFIAMMDSIIIGLRIMSYLIIGIILLILGNTMAMSARERISEYALLKTLGFRPGHLLGLIFGESLTIAIVGGVIGIIMTFPVVETMAQLMQGFIPSTEVKNSTIVLSIIFVVSIGMIASLFPIYRATKLSIVEGLRKIA